MYDEPSDEPLESLLREHLAGELDPQLGRAEAAFRRHAEEGLVERSRPSSLRHWGLWASLAAALAATIVVVIVLQKQQQPVAMPSVPQASAPAAPTQRQATDQPAAPQPAAVAEQRVSPAIASPAVDAAGEPSSETVAAARPETPDEQAAPLLVRQGVEYRVLESEIVELDSRTPARKLRRQRLDQREYIEPQHGARMKIVVPREEIRYESIPTR